MIDVSKFTNCSLACIMLLIDRMPAQTATIADLRKEIGLSLRTIQYNVSILVKEGHLVQVGKSFLIPACEENAQYIAQSQAQPISQAQQIAHFWGEKEEKQPTTLTFVNLTEPNLTNGDFNLENSVSRQQTAEGSNQVAEGRQQRSDNCRLKTENHEVKPRQKRSHFALAAIPRQPAEKSDYRFSIQERLSQSRSNQFSEGTIFVSGDPPWMYLYRMLADLGIDEITDPAAPLVKVPAYNVFVDSLPRFYGMFHRKPVKDKPVYDTVLHCLAYLHAKKHPDFAEADAVNNTFKTFQQEKKNAKGRIELWTPVLQAMQSIYDEEYYGWNPSLNQYRDFWGAEVKFAHEHGFEPRKDLFYSYFTKLKLMTAESSEQSAGVR